MSAGLARGFELDREDGQSVAHPVAGDGVEGGVAVAVDRVGTEHGVSILGGEHLVDHRAAVVAVASGPPDRAEQ
jgi:hypothetical protein